MFRKYNLRLIKKRDSYSSKGISNLFGVCKRTIYSWKKAGLKTLSDNPFLVMGFELYDFLEKRIQERRVQLKSNEFFCVKCQASRRSVDNRVLLKISKSMIGNKGFRGLLIQGNCEVCNSKINRFSHTGNLEQIKKDFYVFEEVEEDEN